MLTEIFPPTHIQIGSFNRSLLNQPVNFSELVNLKYKRIPELGPEEIDKGLQLLYENQKDLTWFPMDSGYFNKSQVPKRVHVLHILSPLALSHYWWRIHRLYCGYGDSLERTHFGNDRDGPLDESIDFWWDLRNGFIWSLRYDCLSQVKSALERTFMDEKLFPQTGNEEVIDPAAPEVETSQVNESSAAAEDQLPFLSF